MRERRAILVLLGLPACKVSLVTPVCEVTRELLGRLVQSVCQALEAP